MKKITTFLGCVGVVCLISGCSSNDDLEKIVLPNQPSAEVASSSSSNSPSSSATAAPGKSSNSGSASTPASSGNSPIEAPIDTVHKEVVITSSPSDYPDPYFSSGIFCWTEECEKQWAGVSSASAPKSSSSITIDIGMSVEAPVYPTVTETQMIDARDQSVYNLVRIGGVHWMNENLKYKPSSGVYCDHNGEDVCATYGGFYTYSRAQAVCPAGWRLPTQAEVEAANLEKGHDWWTIGGRFKLTSSGESDGYGLDGEQGYLWLAAGTENNAWRVEDYTGKQIEEATSATDRAFNVRCVEGE